jgi:hypothetical protein
VITRKILSHGSLSNKSRQVPHPTRSAFVVLTSRQEGQTKTSSLGRTPSLGIVRKCFMVSPQERHTKVGALLGTGGECSIAGRVGVQPEFGMCKPLKL